MLKKKLSVPLFNREYEGNLHYDLLKLINSAAFSILEAVRGLFLEKVTVIVNSLRTSHFFPAERNANFIKYFFYSRVIFNSPNAVNQRRSVPS